MMTAIHHAAFFPRRILYPDLTIMDINKRYQVFVSTTFVDLQEERQAVFRKILSLPCFPAGMEWFPAQTDEQWKVIQRVIDAAVTTTYSSSAIAMARPPEGLSYTEKEFDFMQSRKVIQSWFYRTEMQEQ